MPIVFLRESALVVTDDQIYSPTYWDENAAWCAETANRLREDPDGDIGFQIFRPGYESPPDV